MAKLRGLSYRKKVGVIGFLGGGPYYFLISFSLSVFVFISKVYNKSRLTVGAGENQV